MRRKQEDSFIELFALFSQRWERRLLRLLLGLLIALCLSQTLLLLPGLRPLLTTVDSLEGERYDPAKPVLPPAEE